MSEPLIIKFFVPGTPQQAGSASAWVPRHPRTRRPYEQNGRIMVNVADSNAKKLKPWQQRVGAKATLVYRDELLSGPLKLSCRFYFVRPSVHYYKRKSGDVLRDDAPHFHTNKPDVGKLVRAIEDALTDVVWVDDRQVCRYGFVEKVYTEKAEGVLIQIETLTDPGPQPYTSAQSAEATH